MFVDRRSFAAAVGLLLANSAFGYRSLAEEALSPALKSPVSENKGTNSVAKLTPEKAKELGSLALDLYKAADTLQEVFGQERPDIESAVAEAVGDSELGEKLDELNKAHDGFKKAWERFIAILPASSTNGVPAPKPTSELTNSFSAGTTKVSASSSPPNNAQQAKKAAIEKAATKLSDAVDDFQGEVGGSDPEENPDFIPKKVNGDLSEWRWNILGMKAHLDAAIEGLKKLLQ